MAAGVTVHPDNLAEFRAHLNEHCGLTSRDFAPRFEVLPAQSNLTLHDWARLMDRLEPLGAANPRPSILLSNAVFLGLKYLKRPADPRPGALLDPLQPPVLGAAFGVEVRFRDPVAQQVYTATWFAPERAARVLSQKSGPFHVVLAIRHDAATGSKPGPTYRWIVEHVEPASQDDPAGVRR